MEGKGFKIQFNASAVLFHEQFTFIMKAKRNHVLQNHFFFWFYCYKDCI